MHSLETCKRYERERERERERKRELKKDHLSDSNGDISSYLRHDLSENVVLMLDKFGRFLKK